MEQPTLIQRLRRLRDIREELRIRHSDGDLWREWLEMDVILAKREVALMDEICREQARMVVA